MSHNIKVEKIPGPSLYMYKVMCFKLCSGPLCPESKPQVALAERFDKAMAELSLQQSALQDYVVDANDVLRFKLVSQEKDLDNESLEFAPEMCHQVRFGRSDPNK